MYRNSGLGVNITPDLVNDFFTLKPKAQQTPKYVKHRAATTHLSTGTMTQGSSTSGGMTPGNAFNINDVQYFEQQLKLGSVDEDEDFQQEDEEVSPFLLPEPINEEESAANQQEMSTEVYDNYSFDHEYDSSLPVTQAHEQIIQTIEANRVTIIQGSTGSGKTTQVPQFILDHYQEKGKFCNILVTQPRKIAAITVAQRVSQERNWPLGTLVGYQVARDRQVSEDTRITYLTTGVLLQKLVKNKHLNDYTHVILDEVHERDQDIDFSMLVVRYYLKTVSKHVKVVLMSATADCSLFSNYFSILINNRKEGAPVISVEGKMYDVDEYYFEDIRGLADIPQQTIYDPEINEKCFKLCRELIMKLDQEELQERYEPGIFAENRGTVLCFLPGVPQIKELRRYLVDLETKLKLRVMPLHSKISNSEQVQVFYPAKNGERKIILSTNIAESSVTVSDIKYVIDFCLTKETECDRDTKYQRLMLKWASKASLIQRRGRAGRVSQGHCFRLISKHFYDELDDYAIPEMARAPLEQLILQVKLLELGPSPSMTLQLALQPPRVSAIKSTILLLKEVGALTIRQNGKINPLDGDITFLGRVLGSLPVDVHISKLLLMGYTFGVLEECLVIGACLSLKSIFSNQFNREYNSYSMKMKWSNATFCDMLTSLNAFLSWKHKKTSKGFGMHEKKWAIQNGLEWKRFDEVNELVEDLRRRLLNYNIQTHRDIYMREVIEKDDELVLKLVIAGAFYPNYFQSEPIDEDDAAKTMSGHDPATTIVVHGAPSTIEHYSTRVSLLFKYCGVGKALHYNNTRIFVEFHPNMRTNECDFPISTSIYLALKMRQLRMPLNLLVSKEKDEAFRVKKDHAVDLISHETGLRTSRVNTDLQSQERNISVSTCSTKHVELKYSGYFHLIVQELHNPSHFWATYADNMQLMYDMNQMINHLDGMNLPVLEEENIVVGGLCLAPFDGGFFRAEIKDVKTEKVQCFFVDYGNSAYIYERQMLRRCSDVLSRYPYQAFECYLSEVKPVQGVWSADARNSFTELVPIGTGQVYGKIYSVVHGTYRLELFSQIESENMISNYEKKIKKKFNEEKHININRMLIEEGHAVFMEEPVLSKNYHETFNSEGTSSSEHSSSTGIEEVLEEPGANEEVIKITLRGPYSAYEMSFGNITALGRSLSTRVEIDSVNSVLVSEREQASSPRLMVAAAITMNPTGSTMNARETCLLPNIRGLASILTLLFSPEAELRVDKKETCLTGAICGLGYDDNGDAILPDHDIEVTFNVKLDDNDLLMINSVRYLINEAIGIDQEKIEHAPKKMQDIQNHARARLMTLINTQRESMESKPSGNYGRWKKLSENQLLHCPHEAKPTHLFVYHDGVFFQSKEPSIDPRIAELRKALDRFHVMAGDSVMPFPCEVVCPACQVICRHPRGLFLHCESRTHQMQVDATFDVS